MLKLTADWLTVFGEVHGREITDALVEIYSRAFQGEVTPEELAVGCELALKECKFFPKPAEVIERSRPAAQDQLALRAEQAWTVLQAHITKWGTDGTPLYSGGRVIHPPKLDDPTSFAVRQIGSLSYVGRHADEAEVWVRKSFLEHYIRFVGTDGLSRIPGREESRNLIEKFAPALIAKPKFQRRELKPNNAPEPELEGATPTR